MQQQFSRGLTAAIPACSQNQPHATKAFNYTLKTNKKKLSCMLMSLFFFLNVDEKFLEMRFLRFEWISK